MKRFLPWSVVPALLALVGIVYFNSSFHMQYAPAIRVVLQDGIGGGGHYLPAVDGIVQDGGSVAASDTGPRYQTNQTYKVVSTPKGHFVIMAHYKICRGASTVEVDRMLPVWDKQPKQTQWSKVDDQLVAFAYLTGTQTGY